MSGPTPNDVGTGDLYDRIGAEPLIEKTEQWRAMLAEAVDNPQEADGWIGILLPAIATAVALSIVRRYL